MICEICNSDPCVCEITEDDYEYGEPEVCDFCGKPLEEFGDMGCGKCDKRHPEFGVTE